MSNKMNPKVKQMWIEALESGKYKKGRYFLRPTTKTFCCLGVLCDLHKKVTKKKKAWTKNIDKRNEYLGEDNLLPTKVMKWAGIKKSNPKVSGGHLSTLNDHFNKSFKQIAKLIEQDL